MLMELISLSELIVTQLLLVWGGKKEHGRRGFIFIE